MIKLWGSLQYSYKNSFLKNLASEFIFNDISLILSVIKNTEIYSEFSIKFTIICAGILKFVKHYKISERRILCNCLLA